MPGDSLEACVKLRNLLFTVLGSFFLTLTCSAVTTFTISVAVIGLTGTLVMQDNKSANLTFTADNTQTLATPYTSGVTYVVRVQTQPAGQAFRLRSDARG